MIIGNKMKVWIVRDTEPLPMLTGNGRLMRAGMFSEYFSSMGNDVTWWVSTWLHYEKRFFSKKDEIIKLNDNLTIKMLHPGKAYDKHVSLDRIAYCKRMQKKFEHAIKCEEKPDLIYCSWPLIELSYACVKYGAENHIPTIIDIRDLWPDIFVQPFKGIIKSFVNIAVHTFYGRIVKYTLNNATKVISVIPKGIEFAKKYGRNNENDHVVFLSYKKSQWTDEELKSAEEFWSNLNVSADDYIIVFVGNIGLRIAQLNLIVEAAKKEKDKKTKYVLCGGGPDLDSLKQQTKDCDNIVFAGYRNAPEIAYICSIAKLGLLPYFNTFDFIDHLPNKVGEYFSFGLPLLTTLSGLSKQVVEQNECGAYFDTADKLGCIVEKYKSDNEFYLKHRNNAEKLFKESFDADVVYKNFVIESEALVEGRKQ